MRKIFLLVISILCLFVYSSSNAIIPGVSPNNIKVQNSNTRPYNNEPVNSTQTTDPELNIQFGDKTEFNNTLPLNDPSAQNLIKYALKAMLWYLLITAFVYFIPTIIVIFNKNNANKTLVILLNLFLGWTFVGWVIALTLALQKNMQNSDVVNNIDKDVIVPFQKVDIGTVHINNNKLDNLKLGSGDQYERIIGTIVVVLIICWVAYKVYLQNNI